ncbi:MAG: DUF695 domain-containing protein [Kofleriaceae bacterium]|nr:DUF695 domain-containing protein [Kofleriaceae bacterium]
MAETDEWDFYPCEIDHVAASIFLNLRYEHDQPPADADTLYRIRLPMVEPEDHGMGSAAEAQRVNALEDEMCLRAESGGLVYVARIRSRAEWEIVFYGPAARTDTFQSLREVFGERRTYADIRPDPAWGFYREFLLPDEERRMWMEDRRVVQALADRGDALTKPRRVDHWVHFATAEARDRFVRAAQEAGFQLERAATVEGGALPFGAQLHRVDPVELEHIHAVAMELVDLAAPDGGDYDGWETSMETE